MLPLLAQDGIKVPAPPATNDVAQWIAIALVITLIVLVGWTVTKGIPKAMAALAAERADTLVFFAAQMDAQRKHDMDRGAAIHGRLDAILDEMRGETAAPDPPGGRRRRAPWTGTPNAPPT